MGNSWFQFRQFRVGQASSSMKVCTDSCLFAALVAAKESARIFPPDSVLDPGCGTGLLSLMLAQKLPLAHFTGIELHPGSAGDCRENFQASPWSSRLQLLEADFLSISLPQKFDCIICNPPFFISHLPSPDSNRNLALHTAEANLANWLAKLGKCMQPGGRLWLLTDENAVKKVADLALNLGLKQANRINFLKNPDRIFRVVSGFVNGDTGEMTLENKLVINEKGSLSSPASDLMADYYLRSC